MHLDQSIDSPRIYIDRHYTGQPRRLWDLIEESKRDDPLAPATVVGPSNYANLSLRHELARSGFANVRFLPIPRLAELLGAPSLAARGRTPLTSIVESAAIRAVSESASGPLGELRFHPSTHQSLKGTFRELRHASDSALERLAARPGLQAEVVNLYRRFRGRTNTFYDSEDLAQAAADAIRRGEATGLTDLGLILFYQVRDVTPAQAAMIEALSDAGGCAALLGLTGDDEADAPVNALANRLSRSLGPANVSTKSDDLTSTQLLVAADPHQEVRWIIRHMMRQAEDGTPFHRMAALYRKQDPYAAFIREELTLAGIPIAGPDPMPLSDTAVGRTITGLTQLSDGEFTRDAVTSWLTGCPVRPPGGNSAGFSPSRWDAITKSAGIVGGLERWTGRLERYAFELELSSETGEAQGELSEGRAAQMRSEAGSARSMLRFIEDLARHTVRPADGSGWSVFSSWAGGLLDRYLVHENDMPESEQKALEKVRNILSELEGAQAVNAAPTFSVFEQALAEALQVPLGHVGLTGQGVFVAPIGTATAMKFDTVYIAGMIEGAVPPAIRDDPLIPDRQRRAAGGESSGLPLRSERTVKERYDFLTALASAPNRVLSYPVADPAGQRANYPSRWFLEQATVLEGSKVYTSDLPKVSGRPWLTVIPSMEGALASVSGASAADPHDYDLERLWHWTKAGLRISDHPIAMSSRLTKSLSLGRERYGSRFGEWDGDLSSVHGSNFAARLGRSIHSPTRLERWAKCPFSYFLGNVLRIGAVEKPEDVHTITALEKGSLVHEILERFIRHVDEQGTLPGPSEHWSAEHRDVLRRVAESGFEEAESRGVTGKPLMWEMEREDILTDLYTFLEQDSAIRERFGVSPSSVEARFGMTGDSWPPAVFTLDDGTVIRFRGVIDRVDVGEGGASVLVLDYKTGSAWSYRNLADDPIDRGQRLQLGVYSLAARAALGADADVSAAYWFVTSRDNFALSPAEPFSLGNQSVMERFAEGVSTIVSGIRSGAFPANPGKLDNRGGFENCRYCDFDSLCPSRRNVLWSRKQRDPRLADYVRLSGEDE